MRTKYDCLDVSFLEETDCKSPIVVQKINRNCAIVAFCKKLFHEEVLEKAAAETNQAVETVWLIDKYSNKSVSSLEYMLYIITLQLNFGKQADDILATIANKFTKEVYLGETSMNLSELMFTDSYTNSVSIPAISIETKKALLAAGIKNGRKLDLLTREELCCIPGMKTKDVFNLEKNLAVRGIFLKTRIDT